MREVTITVLTIALLGATACKSGASDQPDPEPTAESEMQAESEQSASGETESRGQGGPHSEEIGVELVGEPTVAGPGTLSPTAIANVAEKRQQRTVTCFESMEGDIEEPSRQVMLTLQLSRDGVVLGVQSSAQDEFGDCVAAEVERWEFPKPEGGEVESTFKFEYQRRQEDQGEDSSEE